MKQRWSWMIIGAVITVAGGAWWVDHARKSSVWSDGASISLSADALEPRRILWQPPRAVSELVHDVAPQYEPRLSWDGLTLYFVRGKAGENADIYSSRRTVDGWSEPQPLAALNSEYDELGPAPSPDGSALYFYSDRPGGSGGFDLWMARYGPDGLAPPVNLGPRVNSPYNDYGPALASDRETLYFASNRPRDGEQMPTDDGKWSATLRERFEHHDYDLYRAVVDESGAQPAERLSELSTAFNEGAPAVTPSGDFLYFASDRPGGVGGYDLYRVRMNRPGTMQVERLDDAINTAANELDPGLTMGGFALYFSSNRNDDAVVVDGTDGITESPAIVDAAAAGVGTAHATTGAAAATREYAIYFSESREVFSQSLRDEIDYAALWQRIWPNLAWLSLLALLLLGLLWLLRDTRGRRLSLLMKCLIASFMLHLLILMATNFWQITSALGDSLRRGGRIQITMSSAGAGDLASQIRGVATSELSLEAMAVESPRDMTPTDAMSRAIELPKEPTEAAISRLIEIKTPTQESMTRDAAMEPAAQTDVAQKLLQQSLEEQEQFAAALPSESTESLPTPTEAADRSHNVVEPVSDIATQEAEAARDVQLVAAVTVESADVLESAQSRPTPRAAATQPVVVDLAERSSARDSVAPNAAVAERDFDTPASLVALPVTAASDVSLPSEVSPQSRDIEQPSTTLSAMSASASRRDGEVLPAASIAHDAAMPSSNVVTPSIVARGDPVDFESTAHEAEATMEITAAEDGSAPRDAEALSAGLIPPPQEQSLQVSMPDAEVHATGESAVALTASEAKPMRNDAGSDMSVASIAIDSSSPDAPASPSLVDSNPATYASSEPGDAAVELIASKKQPFGLLPPPVTIPDPDETLTLRIPDELAPPEPARTEHGALRGRVIDIDSGEPIEAAVVRMNLPDGTVLEAQTDAQGRYELTVPRSGELPEFVAVSASHDLYGAESANIRSAAIERRSARQKFELHNRDPLLISLEDEPIVHHVGNDRFAGRINSQFQVKAEGTALIARFELSAAQLGQASQRVRLKLLARGVQCPMRLRINGALLDETIQDAPDDGSFGERSVTFPARLFTAGENSFEIETTACRGDLDDFEFINVRFELRPR